MVKNYSIIKLHESFSSYLGEIWLGGTAFLPSREVWNLIKLVFACEISSIPSHLLLHSAKQVQNQEKSKLLKIDYNTIGNEQIPNKTKFYNIVNHTNLTTNIG